MKLTGPACTEALSEAEEAEQRERAEDTAGGVRVERRVRRTFFGTYLLRIRRQLLGLLLSHVDHNCFREAILRAHPIAIPKELQES